MNMLLRFKSHWLACVVFSVLLTSLSGTRLGRASESVDEVVNTKESASSSLRFLKKSLEEYPAHRAELIAAALETFAADEENLQRVIYVARQVFPEETTALVEELMMLSPDAVVSLRSAFLAESEVMQAALAEFWGKESNSQDPAAPTDLPSDLAIGEAASAEPTIDSAQAVPATATFTFAVDESIVDPATAVDVSFDLSGPKHPALPSRQTPSQDDVTNEVVRDQIKLPETSASADESSLNNSLEFDETNERDLAKAAVRIDDAWKPSDDIYLDESKFEKRRLAAAQEAAPEAPQERAELEFQSTVDHQSTGFGRPPLNLPAIGPEL